MPIKHLVLGGGGAGGFAIYGALRYLAKNNFWELNQIKSMYSTSIGSLIAVLIIICDDLTILDDYITKRPWDKVITVNPIDIINLWQEKGIFNVNTVKEILEPVFKAKNFSVNMTLKELYDYSKIELHMYTTNLNAKHPEKIDLSYKTHGDLDVATAVTMSAAFPVFIAPICDASSCYMDGGLVNNFPIDDCLLANPNEEEILAIKVCSTASAPNIDNNSNLMNYLYRLLNGMHRLIRSDCNQCIITNLVCCDVDVNDFVKWGDALTTISTRQELLDVGETCAQIFLEKISSNLDC
jgi:NTE family protein